jgi:hypothetical protein
VVRKIQMLVTHEARLIILGHEGSANQNDSEIPRHPVRWTGVKVTKAAEDVGGRNTVGGV